MPKHKNKQRKGKGRCTGPRKPLAEVQQKEEPLQHQLTRAARGWNVTAAKELWETLNAKERAKVLRVDIHTLRQVAKAIDDFKGDDEEDEDEDEEEDHPHYNVSEVIEEGLQRLRDEGVCRLWWWSPDQQEFSDVKDFKAYLRLQHVPKHLQYLLAPEGKREEGKEEDGEEEGLESPIQEGFRERMTGLLVDILNWTRQFRDEGPARKKGSADEGEASKHDRRTMVETVRQTLNTMWEEHDVLYFTLVGALIDYLEECAPGKKLKSTSEEFVMEDLRLLDDDDLHRVLPWLADRAMMLATRIRPESDEAAAASLVDVDLFVLSSDKQHVTVNPEWLKCLEDTSARMVTDMFFCDSCQTWHKRTAHGHSQVMLTGEGGLLLEWIAETLLVAHQRARDIAKRLLGKKPPCPVKSWQMVVKVLEMVHHWQSRATAIGNLLAEWIGNTKVATRTTVRRLFGEGKVEDRKEAAPPQGALPGLLPSKTPDARQRVPKEVFLTLQRELLVVRGKTLYLEHEQEEKKRGQLLNSKAINQVEQDLAEFKGLLEVARRPIILSDSGEGSTAEKLRQSEQKLATALTLQLHLQSLIQELSPSLAKMKTRQREIEERLKEIEGEMDECQRQRAVLHDILRGLPNVEKGGGHDSTASGQEGDQPSSFGSPQVSRVAVSVTESDLPAGSTDEEAESDAASFQYRVMYGNEVAAILKKKKDASRCSSEPGADSSNQSTGVQQDTSQPENPALRLAQAVTSSYLGDRWTVKKGFTSEEDEHDVVVHVASTYKTLKAKIAHSLVVVWHLESYVTHICCDDPGGTISDLALMVIRKRLDCLVAKYEERRAKELEEEVLRMEIAPGKNNKKTNKNKQKGTSGTRVRQQHLKITSSEQPADEDAVLGASKQVSSNSSESPHGDHSCCPSAVASGHEDGELSLTIATNARMAAAYPGQDQAPVPDKLTQANEIVGGCEPSDPHWTGPRGSRHTSRASSPSQSPDELQGSEGYQGGGLVRPVQEPIGVGGASDIVVRPERRWGPRGRGGHAGRAAESSPRQHVGRWKPVEPLQRPGGRRVHGCGQEEGSLPAHQLRARPQASGSYMGSPSTAVLPTGSYRSRQRHVPRAWGANEVHYPGETRIRPTRPPREFTAPPPCAPPRPPPRLPASGPLHPVSSFYPETSVVEVEPLGLQSHVDVQAVDDFLVDPQAALEMSQGMDYWEKWVP